jgi:hypothetical protein
MTSKTLTRAAWLRHQCFLWALSLFGGGGLLWWASTQEWPGWVDGVLGMAVISFFAVGGPSTYGAYLREEQDQADLVDLPPRDRGGVLGKCRPNTFHIRSFR